MNEFHKLTLLSKVKVLRVMTDFLNIIFIVGLLSLIHIDKELKFFTNKFFLKRASRKFFIWQLLVMMFIFAIILVMPIIIKNELAYYLLLVILIVIAVVLYRDLSIIQLPIFLFLQLFVVVFFIFICVNHSYHLPDQNDAVVFLLLALLCGSTSALITPPRFKFKLSNKVLALIYFSLVLHLFRVNDTSILNTEVGMEYKLIALGLSAIFIFLISKKSHAKTVVQRFMSYFSKILFTILAVVGIFIATISISNSKYAQWKTLSKLSNAINKQPVVWFKSLNRASEFAKKKKSLILVDLWAKWCKPCHKMEKEVFQSPKFKALIEKYNIVLVKLDFSKTSDYTDELSRKYEIMGLPTVLVLDYKKYMIQAIVGYKSAQKTIAKIEKILVDYKSN